jgi:hypothetical protein
VVELVAVVVAVAYGFDVVTVDATHVKTSLSEQASGLCSEHFTRHD